MMPCALCNGSGFKNWSNTEFDPGPECEECSGSGMIEEDCETCDGTGVDESGETCDDCAGAGYQDVECEACDGSGVV